MQKVDTTFFASTHRTKVLRSSTSLAEDGTLTPYRGSVFAPEIAAPTLQEVNPIRIGGEGQLQRAVEIIGFTMGVDEALQCMDDLIALPAGLVGGRWKSMWLCSTSAVPPECRSRTLGTGRVCFIPNSGREASPFKESA